MAARTKGWAQLHVGNGVQFSALNASTDTSVVPTNQTTPIATDRADAQVFLVAGVAVSVRWGGIDANGTGTQFGWGITTNSVVARCDVMYEGTQTSIANDSVSFVGNPTTGPIIDRTFSFTPTVTGTYRLKVNQVTTVTVGGAAFSNDNTDNGNFGSAAPSRTAGVTLSDFTPGLIAVGTALDSFSKTPAGSNIGYHSTIVDTFTMHVGSQGTDASENYLVSLRDATDTQFKSITINPTTAAAKSDGGYKVDTTLPLANTAVGIHFSFGNSALSTALGGAGIPWTFIPTAGILTGWTAVTSNAVGATEISKAGLYNVDPRIFTYKDLAHTQPGVGVFADSGYTTAQNIFKRTGTVNITNAVPYLEAYLTDGFGTALASLTNAFSAAIQRMSDSGVTNTQTLSTDANGRVRWNHTIAATSAAFNRFIKTGVTRATGSHVATGPDNPATPPATFSVGNGAYTGAFPGYGRKVVMSGTGFSAGNEPSVTTNNVYGVNSEIIFEDMWTGAAVNEAVDSNGCPNGPGQREQTLGAGSLKAKVTTLIDEGTVRVITPSEYNPKDIAGRNVDLAGAEVLSGRRALWNQTTLNADDPGTNLSNSYNLDTPLGYATGTTSFDSIAAPADPASLIYYQFYKDIAQGNEATEDASGFLLATTANVGMQTDQGNFGYFAQNISFIAVDLTVAIVLTPKVSQQSPGVSVRFGAKVLRVAADDTFNDVHPDAAPIYVGYGLNDDGSQTALFAGSMLPLGNPATTADYYFDVTMPGPPYFALKLKAFAKVNGSRTPGGDTAFVQIGWQFDPIGTFTGFQFK